MAGKSAISTRSKNEMKFSGPLLPLQKTEPPIYRQIIQYSYYLINTYPHLSNFAISKLIAKEVIDIWKAVNPRLPLLNEMTIIKKVSILCFKKAKEINRKSLPASRKKFLIEKLDSLFDISSCSCKLPVLSCDDYHVKCHEEEHCKIQHIICTCPLQQKVPVEDREYLKDQRSKIGPKGTFQLGPVDRNALKKSKKKVNVLRKKLHPSPSTSNVQDNVFSPSYSSSPNEEPEEYLQPKTPTGPYSLIKFPRYALELVRGGISSNLGASLANAFLLDLKAAGLLIPNINMKDIIIDKSKVDRAKTKVKITAQQKHDESVENIICIGVDGRMDKNTLMYKEIVDENRQRIMKKIKGPEHHLTFTKETPCESKYLTHRVLPNSGATGAVHADQVVDVLHEFHSENSIKAILVDNTNTNTGCEGGMVAILEKKLFKNLHTIGCSLHHNELPFRALFKNIDGCAKGPTTFSGPLGKLCSNDCHDLPQISFSTISNPLESIFKIDETHDISYDQRLLYEYTVGISRGKVDSRYDSWKIGPLNQARWLTLAIRLMCLWTRGAYPQRHTTKLHYVVNFIVNVYATSWFEIKRNNKFHNQQVHIFNMIQRIKEQPQEIQDITFRNIQGNTFCLLPENVLYSMVKSEEIEVREEALKRILAIRSEESTRKRLKRIPPINFNATHWTQLIDLKLCGIFEPPMTEDFTESELRESLMNGIKLDLPDLPSHSQGVERAVKLITEASQTVYGFEARHQHITAKVLSQKLRPAFSSKGSYMEQFDSVY